MTGTHGRTIAAPSRPAGIVGRLVAGFIALVVVTPLASAAGDRVPLPNLRPDHGVRVSRPAEVTAAIARPSVVPNFSPNSRFTREQQVALAHINTYFNSFQTMEGQFVQFGPYGEQSEGIFFMSRPGKIRFHYNAPASLDIISDGSSVAINNKRTNTQDLYPLSKTPLRYLLANEIDLTSQNLVDSIREEPDLISLLIVEKSALVSGSLTLIFDRKSYELRQWIVTDAQGLNTAVAIYNLALDKPQDGNLFRITVMSGG